MNSTLATADRLEHNLLPLLIVVGALGFGVLAFSLIVRSETIFGVPRVWFTAVGLMLFAGLILADSALTRLLVEDARATIATALLDPVTEVRVSSGTPIDTELVRVALRRMDNRRPDHSRPLASTWIEVATTKETFPLLLRADAKDPLNYWVFTPRYHVTRLNEVGHIHLAP